MFDLMLDEDHVELEEVPEWIERVSRLTAGVANGPRDPQRRRQLTNALFLQDVGPELATEASRAGLSQPAFRTWLLTQSDEDINRMPALGIYREVFREKLLNPTTRWSPNDLLDMIYLSCAAGYVDEVVGERHQVAGIKNAMRRLGRSRVGVHRRLEGLVDALSL